MVSCRQDGRRGMALYLVLVVAVLLLAAGAVLGMHLQKRMSTVIDQQKNLHADALLDSGLAQAMAILSDNYLYQGTRNLDLDGGRVTVKIAFYKITDVRSVEVTATYRGKTRRGAGLIAVHVAKPPRVAEWGPMPALQSDGP